MRRGIAVALALFAVVWLLPLGVTPLHSPDETRYAEIPREMIATGDWVVPHLDGVRYLEKPALGYWLTAASMLAFGENAFAARLPQAVSVALTALTILLLGRVLDRRRRLGETAAAIYLTCILVFVVGTINVLDSLLTLTLTCSLAAFHVALRSAGGRRLALLAASGACCGLAFLTKGFLAPVIVLLVVGPYLVLTRRWREAPVALGVCLGVATLVALPWSLAIALREPAFWHDFFWVEHVARFTAPVSQDQHPEPFWYFVPILLAGTLPWIALVPAAAAGYRRPLEDAEGTLFLGTWLVLPFLFFSASTGKLATYVLPVVPPFALLVARGLAGCTSALRGARLLRAGAGACAALVAGGAAFVALRGHAWYGAEERAKLAIVVVALGVWAAVALRVALSSVSQRSLWLYAVAPLVLMAVAPLCLPGSIGKVSSADIRGLVAAVGAPIGNAILVADSSTVHAVCWTLGRDDVYVYGDAGELSAGLRHPDAEGRGIPPGALGDFIASRRPGHEVVVIVRRALEPTLLRVGGTAEIGSPTLRRRGKLVLARYGPGELTRPR